MAVNQYDAETNSVMPIIVKERDFESPSVVTAKVSLVDSATLRRRIIHEYNPLDLIGLRLVEAYNGHEAMIEVLTQEGILIGFLDSSRKNEIIKHFREINLCFISSIDRNAEDPISIAISFSVKID